MSLKRTLEHLEALVAFDTQNPPRDIPADGGIIAYLRASLGASFKIDVVSHGDGMNSVLAVRGTPRRLYNFHIDTVPAADGYTADPHVLRVTGDRAIGLGACDIKGASACMLAALEGSSADAALLFTSDEEFGRSTCVREFCKEKHDFDEVVVAEPTMACAVLEHRGIMTATADFTGISGHASSGRADQDSALHHAIDWAHSALEYARAQESLTYGPLNGIRFNMGRFAGGVKPNMVAAETMIRFGFRPLPGMDGHAVLKALWADIDERHTLTPGFDAPSLPAPGHQPAHALAASLGVEVAQAVNFWTEASLFSEAGYQSLVYGPGDIAQAHTADEWVALDQLAEVTEKYRSWL